MDVLPSDLWCAAPKAALRRQLRAARRALTPAQQRQHAVLLARQMQRLRIFRAARRIAYYWAADGEIDPAVLRGRSARAERRWYLPVLRPGGRLWFARDLPGTPLRPNRYGIAEPRRRRGRVGAQQLDLILLPVVGFDARCQRLGRGGAFYDRSLAFLRTRRFWHRPRAIGLAHDLQRVPALPVQPWDIPLAAVVTEAGVYRCQRGL